MKRVLIASALLALTGLGGCGLKGSLERPAPMWGSERSHYLDQQKQAQADAQAAKEAKAQRPHVDIPVESDGTTSDVTPPSATDAKAGTGSDAAVTDTGEPDLKQSGGAVPPVGDITRQRSGY